MLDLPPALVPVLSSTGPLPVGPGCQRGGGGLAWALETLAFRILAWGAPPSTQPPGCEGWGTGRVPVSEPTSVTETQVLDSGRERPPTAPALSWGPCQPRRGAPASPSGPPGRCPDTGEREEPPSVAVNADPGGHQQNSWLPFPTSKFWGDLLQSNRSFEQEPSRRSQPLPRVVTLA